MRRRMRAIERESISLVVAMTHPIQYYSPWFAFITAECPSLSLEVVYATEPTPTQQAVGFGREFRWDTPLRAGYQSTVIRDAAPADSVHSDSFFGLNVPELARAVLDREPDVVLVPGWHSITYLRVLRACRRAGIPTIYRGDSSLLGRPTGWKRAAWSARTRWMLGQYSAYLGVGSRAVEYLGAFGVARERIFESPHCVDNDFFAAGAAPWQERDVRARERRALGVRDDEFVVLFVGKLEPKKRVRDAVLAVAQAGSDYHLLVVGAGAEDASARTAAHELGARVTWQGFVNQASLARFYAVADCLVLPSDHRETWGLVVNEALAAGLPCAVSDRAGCAPDLVIPGVTGERYPCGDATSLASALARIRSSLRNGTITRRTCSDLIRQYSFAQATEGLQAACRFVTGFHH